MWKSNFEITRQTAELAVGLYCSGMQIDPGIEGIKETLIWRRRAGLGSGLEIRLKSPYKAFWVNVPVMENFATRSPYELRLREGHYVIQKEDQSWDVEILMPPAWYQNKTSTGIPMSQIGILQGTYLGIYIGKPCAFWRMDPPQQCQFCATGLNVGIHEALEKTVQAVVETAQCAKQESKITFVHFNSGYQEGQDLRQVLPYVQAIKTQVGALVGVQCIPAIKLQEYDSLIKAGVDHFSFCYELHDPACFERYLPGKAKYIGQSRFFKALEYVAQAMTKGSVSGEIIAGLEPTKATYDAIDYITDCGAFPTVCIFRPLRGTALENAPSPSENEMIPIFQYVAQSCLKKGIPIGLAPNLEVSLVMTPEDCRYFLPQSTSWYYHHYRLKLLRALATPVFALKQSRWFYRMKNL